MTFNKILKSKRITLEQNEPSIEFAHEIFAQVDRNREFLGKWLDWVHHTQRPEDSMKFLLDSQKQIDEGTKMNYGIFVGSNYVGNLGVFGISPKNRNAEIGYWISQDQAGKGIMPEAVQLVERECFENQNFHRLYLKCDNQNKASARVAQKCGYRLEGILREDSFVEREERFRDTMIFAKLRREFSS